MTWLDLTSTETKTNDFSPLEAGQYLLQCQEAEVKDSKSGGQYLKLKFEVVGSGAGRGRFIWENINIKHSNPKVVEIANQQLKNFMMSAGCKTFKLDSPKNLEGLSAVAKVVIEKNETYGDQNRITFWTPYTANGATKTTTKETTPETFGF